MIEEEQIASGGGTGENFDYKSSPQNNSFGQNEGTGALAAPAFTDTQRDSFAEVFTGFETDEAVTR